MVKQNQEDTILCTLHYMFINVVIYMYMYLFHKFFKCKLYSLTSPSTETGRKRHNNSMSKYNMRALSKVLLAKNASSEKCKERV